MKNLALKHYLLLFICFLMQQTIQAQTPQWHYSRSHGDGNPLPEIGQPGSTSFGDAGFTAVVTDANGNVYAAGRYLAYRYLYVTKFDANGNLIWSHAGEPDDYVHADDNRGSGPDFSDQLHQVRVRDMTIADNGGTDYLYVYGHGQADNGFNNLFVVCYNLTTGAVAWAKSYTDNNHYEAGEITLANNDELILVSDKVLVFIDKDGIEQSQWPAGTATFTETDIKDHIASAVDPAPDFIGSFDGLSATNPVESFSPLANTQTYAAPYDTTGINLDPSAPAGGAMPGMYDVTERIFATDYLTTNYDLHQSNHEPLLGTSFTLTSGAIISPDPSNPGSNYSVSSTEFHGVVMAPDGSLYVSGVSQVNSLYRAWVAKLNKSDYNTSDWAYHWRADHNPTNIALDQNGNLYMMSWDNLMRIFDASDSWVQNVLTKWNSGGDLQWAKIHGGNKHDVTYAYGALEIDTDNDRLILGILSQSFSSGPSSIITGGIQVMNYNGEIQSVSYIDSPDNFYGTQATFDGNGNLYGVAGHDDNTGSEHLFKVKRAILYNNPTFESAAKDSDTQITVTFNINVATNGGNPTDFKVADGVGANFAVSTQADGTASDDKIVLTVANLSSAVGDLKVTYTNNNDEVTGTSNGLSLLTDNTGVTINTDTSAPTMSSGKRDSDTQLTITFSEPVQTNGANPTDFTVKDANNTSYVVSAQADGTAKDTDIVLTVADFSGATGPLTVTYNNAHSEISDFGGNELATDATGVDVNLLPKISSVSLAADNSYIDVTFDLGVYNTDGGSGALEAADFSLGITGGSATAPTVSSVKKNDNTAEGSASALTGGETVIRIFFSTTGAAGGTEVLTATPASNQIFESSGGAALTSQSNNTAMLNDKLGPTVTSVSATFGDGSYPEGTHIFLLVNFSEAVTVTGTPQLVLETGTTDQAVDYSSGSGTTQLTFTYIVQAGDESADLDYKATNSLTLNGGTINDAVGNAAILTLPAIGGGNSLSDNKTLVIDGIAPTVAITSSADRTIGAFTATFTFSEDVTGFAQEDITVGNGAASNFQTTSAKVYTATITPAADGAVTVDVTADKATDGAGNNNTAATQLSVTNDETAPTVLEVTSDATDGTFRVGDVINISVQYDEEVVVTGTPQLSLETGTTDRTIDYVDRSVSTLRFVYTVQAGETSSDLDVLSSSALALNGGTIKDLAGNTADLTVQHGSTSGSLSSNKNLVIDALVSTLATSEAASIETSLATLGGNITDEGGSSVTERGVVYSVKATNADPKIGGDGVTKDDNGTGTGEFSESISGLTENTEYSFRAYAINSSGTVYGEVKTFTTLALIAPTITFTDIDKVYGDADFALAATSNSDGAITYSIEGAANGISLSGTNNATVTLGNIGMVTIRATQAANDIYAEGTKDITLTLTAKELTVTGLTGDDKAQDGTTDATASGEAALSGVIAGDDVSLSGTPVFTFASADVGTEVAITTTGYTLSGDEAGNYSLTQPTLSADITAVLSAAGPTVSDLSVYPNPSEQFLNVKLKEGAGVKNTDIKVYDSRGRNVFLPTRLEGNAAQIEIERLTAGRYLIRVTQSDKSDVMSFIKK